MIDFLNTKSIVTPRGEVAVIARGEEILWKRKKYKKELLYLESTGTQHIVTKIYPDSTYTFDTSVAVLEDGFNCVYWGTRRSGNSGTNNAQCYLNSNTSIPHFSTITLYSTGTTVSENWGSGIEPVVGTLYELSNMTVVPTMLEMIYPIVLFGLNNIGNINASLGICRIGKWTAYSNGNPVCDLIPVLDWNDVPCMYDKVSGELLYNSGAGEFLYGEVIV